MTTPRSQQSSSRHTCTGEADDLECRQPDSTVCAERERVALRLGPPRRPAPSRRHAGLTCLPRIAPHCALVESFAIPRTSSSLLSLDAFPSGPCHTRILTRALTCTFTDSLTQDEVAHYALAFRGQPLSARNERRWRVLLRQQVSALLRERVRENASIEQDAAELETMHGVCMAGLISHWHRAHGSTSI